MQMKHMITLNCSACSLACMFLCAALRSPNICASFVSKLKKTRDRNTLRLSHGEEIKDDKSVKAELGGNLLQFTII